VQRRNPAILDAVFAAPPAPPGGTLPAISTHLEKLKPQPGRVRRGRYEGIRGLLGPLIRGLVRVGVTPNAITVAGLVGSLGTAALILERYWIAAGFVYVASSLLDSLDGAVARESGRASTFGAFFDSTLDRLAEGVVLGAIGVTLAQDDLPVAVGACFVALTGSFLVSYTRARAEGLGVTSNKGGLMSRPERIVLTAAGLFFAPFSHVLEVMVYVLAALTVLTVAQRIDHVRRALAGEPDHVPEKEKSSQ